MLDDEDTLEIPVLPRPESRTAAGTIELPTELDAIRACPRCGSTIHGRAKHDPTGWQFSGTCTGCRRHVTVERRLG